MTFMKPEQPLPLEKSLRSLRHLSSVSYCFKPADPSLKAQLSPELQQHRCGYCLAVKADPRRMQACIEADDGRAAAPFSEPRRVECPFGVQEWLIPIWHDDTYQGCLFVGEHGGNPDRVPSGLEVEFQSLTREEHGDAAAVGRVFQELYLRHLEQGRTAALLQLRKCCRRWN